MQSVQLFFEAAWPFVLSLAALVAAVTYGVQKIFGAKPTVAHAPVAPAAGQQAAAGAQAPATPATPPANGHGAAGGHGPEAPEPVINFLEARDRRLRHERYPNAGKLRRAWWWVRGIRITSYAAVVINAAIWILASYCAYRWLNEKGKLIEFSPGYALFVLLLFWACAEGLYEMVRFLRGTGYLNVEDYWVGVVRVPKEFAQRQRENKRGRILFGLLGLAQVLMLTVPKAAAWITLSPNTVTLTVAAIVCGLILAAASEHKGIKIVVALIVIGVGRVGFDFLAWTWGDSLPLLQKVHDKVLPPKHDPQAASWTAIAVDPTEVADFNANAAAKAYIIMPGQTVWLGKKGELGASGMIGGACDVGYWVEGQYYLPDSIMDPVVTLHLARGKERVILDGWRNRERMRELLDTPMVTSAAEVRMRLGLKGQEAEGINRFSSWADINAQIEKKYGLQDWMMQPGGVSVGLHNGSQIPILVRGIRIYPHEV